MVVIVQVTTGLNWRLLIAKIVTEITAIIREQIKIPYIILTYYSKY